MEDVTERNIHSNGIDNQESDGNTSFLRAARNGQLEKVLEHLKTNIDINTSNANGLNALHLASKDGHVEIVEELLKRGAIVDAATKKGNTALHIASLAGQEEVVKLLVHHGASVNVQSQNGFTPLYMAAQENHDNVVKFLLANGANQSLSTEDGFTPLAVAMQQGHDKVVTVLLENDTRGKVRLPALHIAAKKDDVRAAKLLLENDHNPDVTSKSGFTPLHIASHYGNQSIANLLIQKGADVNYSAKHNITPLHVAAKWGKNNMVAVLLEQGAHIEAKTRDGLTPLHCAARSGHEQVVDMLLEKSAPISSKTKNGLAPLHMAAQGDHVDAARILLYHRAPVDEVTVDYLTALHVAAHCGHVRVAKLLVDRQADANARALNGFTPLHIACKKNRIKVVELLLKHGACIGATTESGLTPLHVASFMGCMNIVIYLLQHDASPDIPTVRGETPLHLAARANQTDIIRILLRNGAQVDARAREQQTPLHIASRLGNVDIVMLLLQHGAKVDNSTKDMYTALHIAAKEGQDEVAAVLIENGASLNATTKKGFTPLHLAAKYGHLKVAKLLLQKEAPVDAQGKNGVTPLHVASHYDHQNVALLLLDKGASPHANAKNGHTPLHIAARKNQMDIAHTLLEYGAQPDAESKAGFTPLHLSSQEGHNEISALLLEHKATPSHQSKNGLTPMHLCAQENKVGVAQILHNNGAEIDIPTKGGYTPLHIASHYGQADMVKFLLSKEADVKATTAIGYTPLHQAAQQGHTNIVNILLENSAQPNAVTNNGQTPLNIAQKLGYITVIDTLKEVTNSTEAPSLSEEKYRVVAPEAMQETYLSDSEEEGEDTLLGDQTYRYLTADEMKSLGDDSLPIDVTRDERIDSNRMVGIDDLNAFPPRHIEDSISPEHIHPNYVEYIKKSSDNVDISKHPLNIGFLVSFLVDARGGAMRGCRHSGVRVIVPPRCAHSPTRITCRYVRPQRTPHPPPLMEGEALASRVLELGPVGASFLGPVIIEVPHFAALRGKEREIVVLRSDNGESWKEHTVEATEDVLNEILRDSFDPEDLNQLEDVSLGRITRIVTQDFPQYFAVISRIRQEVHAIGPEGGMVSSTVVPQVQAVFPQGALTKKIKVGLQAQPIDPELTAKMLGHGVAVSPVVTVEPRRRKFHKAITLSMPAPRAHSQGMINQYSGSAPTLRLLCSITGGTSRAQWEDVTGSTPLTFVNDCVSFTTTVSARFWLMDCRNIGDATKMATELYREAIHVPFIAKFMVFAKRVDPLEARLRVFCMTDDKEEKTLEYQEQFTEIAKSRDVEVLEGKSQYIEFVGNLVPVTKSGEQLQFAFRAFKENRLPFSVRVKDQHAEAVSRCLFMREPKVQKGEPPQQPICILNILLPDDIVSDTISLTDSDSVRRKYYATENFDYYRQDPRLADISNLLGDDWVELANQLGLTTSEINVIKSEYPDSVAKQAQSMLRMWLSQSGNRTQANTLDNALRRIGREDIVIQCLNEDNRHQQIVRIKSEDKEKYRLRDQISEQDFSKREDYYLENERGFKTKPDTFDKYSAEEKEIEPSDEEDDFNKTVPEIREQIVKRLSNARTIPASSQRVEIVQEISSIKRKSLVEDKLAEAQQKVGSDAITIITVKPTSKVSHEKKITSEDTEVEKTSSDSISKIPDEHKEKEAESRIDVSDFKTPADSDRRDSILLEEVTHRLESKKPLSKLIADEDPKSPKFSRTPPPSPADFIMREKEANTAQEWCATKTDLIDASTTQQRETSQEAEDTCKQLTEASIKSSTNIPTPQPKPRQKSKEIIEEPIHESDSYTKQISPVRDDLLDEHDRADEISYSDKKKFWENISKHPTQKPPESVTAKKRKSIGEASGIPIPKPRGGLQFSYSLAVTDDEKNSFVEYKEGEHMADYKTDEMTFKEFLEHDSKLSESTQDKTPQTEEECSSRISLEGQIVEPSSDITAVKDYMTFEETISSNDKTTIINRELLNENISDKNLLELSFAEDDKRETNILKNVEETSFENLNRHLETVEPTQENVEEFDSDYEIHPVLSNKKKSDETCEEYQKLNETENTLLKKSKEISDEISTSKITGQSEIDLKQHSELLNTGLYADIICAKVDKSDKELLLQQEVSSTEKSHEICVKLDGKKEDSESEMLTYKDTMAGSKLDEFSVGIEKSISIMPEKSLIVDEKVSSDFHEETVRTKIETSQSTESDSEGSGENSSHGGDNVGYISDSGDVEQYISDSEIEDRVPQIRERQMSVFVAPSVSQRTRYERSASLPTEDLYEISARNIKSRKLYYEEQIKKEMIKEQLTIDLEDDVSPERKSINSSIDVVEVSEREKTETYDVTYPTNEEVDENIQSGQFRTQLHDTRGDKLIPVQETVEDATKLNECITEEEIEIHVDKSETEKSEKASDKINDYRHNEILESSAQSTSNRSPILMKDQSDIHSATSDQPTITVTLSGLQKRISEEEDPYSPKIDCKITDSTMQSTGKSIPSHEIKEEDLSSEVDKTIRSPVEDLDYDADNQINNELTTITNAHQTDYSSIVYPSEVNTDSTIWEVSVESEELKEERLSSLPSIPVAVQSSPIDGKFENASETFVEKEEDLSSELRDESDLGSEIHQDHSDSYASDHIRTDSHSEMKKIILDSLHQQRVDPEEAKMIANSLIAEIELEIQKTESSKEEYGTSSDPVFCPNQQVNNYLKELADAKGLDQREVELVESILERRQKQISKLSRGDTQASSMEITDEDLRYSEGDTDYTHVLEQQMDQLKAEYSDKLKTDYDSLVEDQNEISAKSDGATVEHLEMKYGVDEYQTVKKDSGTSLENQMKNVIIEEDENVSESIVEDTRVWSPSYTQKGIHSTESISDEYKKLASEGDLNHRIVTRTDEENIEVLQKIEGTPEKPHDFLISTDSSEVDEIDLELTSKDKMTKDMNYLTKNSDKTEHSDEISDMHNLLISCEEQELENTSSHVGDLQYYTEEQFESITSLDNKFKLDGDKITTQNEQIGNEASSNKIERTSSSDSKSSAGSAKSPDNFSVSSSDKKIESETFSDVVFRKSKSEIGSSSTIRNKKSAIEIESCSSSGESHYHSFELDGRSRPCSSDVEGIMPTGSSEYESALNSQELSARSQLTSGEYHTAISSLSSKESMRSFESESSGNLASIEVSEASETLVPTNSDLEGDVDMIVDQRILDECELLWPVNSDCLEMNSEQDRGSNEYSNNSSKDSEFDSDQLVEIPSKMKRSYEMTFQPEPKVFTEDSPHTESNDVEERFGTSLDDGSILSVSLSSTSSAQLRTVIELSRNECSGLEESFTSGFSDQIPSEELDSSLQGVDTNSQINSIYTTTQSSEVSEPISIDKINYNENSQLESQKCSHDELKKKGHRRHESTTFIPSLIHSVSKSSKSQSVSEEKEFIAESEQKKGVNELLAHSSDEIKELQIKKDLAERRDSHGKSSSTSSEKSSFEEAEAEAAFSMLAHISPVHKIKQICPIIEDIDAEKSELEAKERLEKERASRVIQNKDSSPGSIPDIKVTEHMAPLDESSFRYPELEMERKELEEEIQKKVEPETSVSNSSRSSEDTDQGKDYVLEDGKVTSKQSVSHDESVHSESLSETKTVIEKSTTEDERTADSPNSDSFELIERPDIIDDFVVIEEVGKEACETDTEGKSVNIQTKPKRVKKHDEDMDAYLAKSDPTPLTKMTELKYFPDNSNEDLEFEFEDSPPQMNFGTEKSKDYGLEYDKELEANRKWIEQQFHGDKAAMLAAGYGYEMEFERGPLEDIKEEDINDIDLASSRIGSLGSQKESGGSLTSVKDSYSSTPDYDVLAGRKYFTKSGEHDDISMSSLQEFENLERAMSLETKKFHHGSGSQDSSSNGSFKTRYYANKTQGDDISGSSLKEFEGLENACIAVHRTEIKVKEEEELLSQIDETQEINLISESENPACKASVVIENQVVEVEDGDYEKRMLEINEIIRQAQSNVERFTDLKETDKTESLGRGDSIEEVSKVPDLDLDAPLMRSKLNGEEDDPMVASTDSLDMNQQRPIEYDSTDSLDQKNNECDIMTASTDSIELNNQLTRSHMTTDSVEKKAETSQMVCSDSLEIAAATTSRLQDDSLEEDEPKLFCDYSSSDTGKDFSSSVKDDGGDHDENLHDLMLVSTDSLEPTSSAATHATYQYESDSVFSGSFTSGGSNTMVSSTDTIDPTITEGSIDIATVASKIWYDKEIEMTEKKVIFEHIGEPSRPYVSEVIEPSDDPSFSHTIHRVVEFSPEVKKVIFRGKDAEENLQRFITDFNEGNDVQETETVDASGNIHMKRVVQKRYIIKPDESDSFVSTSYQGSSTESNYDEKNFSGMALPQLTSLTKSLTGDVATKPSGTTDSSMIRDIKHDSSKETEEAQSKSQTLDQHQLSEEMKELLEEMEKTNKM